MSERYNKVVLNVKRIYEPAAARDGYRVLVDRLWPRGMTKEQAAFDVWLKDIAPSAALREWFGHDPEKFVAFRQSYTAELRHNPALHGLEHIIREHRAVTLLYAAKDPVVNHAVVLRDFMRYHAKVR